MGGNLRGGKINYSEGDTLLFTRNDNDTVEIAAGTGSKKTLYSVTAPYSGTLRFSADLSASGLSQVATRIEINGVFVPGTVVGVDTVLTTYSFDVPFEKDDVIAYVLRNETASIQNPFVAQASVGYNPTGGKVLIIST